jgi:hypothetical protein
MCWLRKAVKALFPTVAGNSTHLEAVANARDVPHALAEGVVHILEHDGLLQPWIAKGDVRSHSHGCGWAAATWVQTITLGCC